MQSGIFWLMFAGVVVAITSSVEAYRNCTSTVYTWEGGPIEFPCATTKRLIKTAGKYSPSDIIVMKAQRVGGKTICAMPRYKAATPITLGQIYATKRGCDVKFEPFPCWAEQEEGNCNGLQSVADIFGTGHYMWVLDTAVINSLRNPTQKCSPKIVVYDAQDGKKLNSINLSRYVNEKSRLQNLQVECLKCGKCYCYVSDAGNNCIIVYDVAGGRGYRVVLPSAVHEGCRFRDVLYTFLIYNNEATSLYFCYLGGTNIFALSTESLRKGLGSNIKDIGTKPCSMVILGTDGATGVFSRREGENNVYFWDTKQNLKQSNFKLVYKGTSGLYTTCVFPDPEINHFLTMENDFPSYVKGYGSCGTLHQITLLDGSQTCSV